MKNLAIHSHVVRNLTSVDGSEADKFFDGSRRLSCCLDPDNDVIYALGEKRLCEISTRNDGEIRFVDLEIDDEAARPVGLEYSCDSGQLWCAYDSGVIVYVASHDGRFHQETTSGIGARLKSLELSPDREILALVTADDRVVTAVSNFHVVSEVDLNCGDYGADEFVTVGWGRKETQFHGREGKAAAVSGKDTITGTSADDETTMISWRGDGAMFAVGFVRREDRVRLFKVFSREGVLRCTGELVAGTEPPLSWKPSGNLIATVQTLANRRVIGFFEKNGLKHRELCLPSKPDDVEIIAIKWSHDSDVLTIWARDARRGGARLELWTENNYHWYCKQTIEFTEDNELVYFAWSSASRAGKRLILLGRRNARVLTFRWCCDHSRGLDERDGAVVGVVDGNAALLTHFRRGIVPPPMSHATVKLDAPINGIIFSPGCEGGGTSLDSNDFVAHLADDRLAFCTRSYEDYYRHVRSCTIEWENRRDGPLDNYSLHHFLWLKERVILCTASSTTTDGRNRLCVIELEGEDVPNDARLVVRDTYDLDDPAEHVVSSPDVNVAYVVAGKSILRYATGEGLISTSLEIGETCERVETIEIANRHVILSLTKRGRFYVDGTEIASNITSFALHSEFLLLTTMQHSLVCVRLDEDGFRRINQDLTITPWSVGGGCRGEPVAPKNWTGLSVRRIERGSVLVVAVSKDCRVVMQMPRGNLECVQPRALSLFIIGRLINEHRYAEAFDAMRKQRVNLNLIYDHDPAGFVENAARFVDEVKNHPSWLSVFLSELHEDDVTVTIYGDCYRDRRFYRADQVNRELSRESKVARVCEMLRVAMESRDDDSRLLVQPILTSLVKGKRVDGLEAALRRIKEIRGAENAAAASSNNGKKSPSDEALGYLLYLVDVDTLFDVAMGMYDFELARFVAAKSTKDPKEFMPLLRELETRETHYMRYSIDRDLKRYERALGNIAKSPGKFDECLAFVREHEMYARALRIFPRESAEHETIARSYGEALTKREKYHEAGIMFARGRALEEALRAYKAAGSWQDAIVVALQLDLSASDMQELYEEMASTLSREKRYREAADILVTCLRQHEDAVSVLCEGKHWRDAMRIAHAVKRLDLMETHVKPGVEEHAGYLLYATSHNREQFEKHRTRLAVVRRDNAARDLRIQEQALGADFDYTGAAVGRQTSSDLLSETSSVTGSLASQSSRTSRTSGRSYRSSKNRRKQERKLLSIKEGSLFEDLALVRALHQIIIVTWADKDEIKLVTQMLLIFKRDERAEQLQNAFGEFLSAIERGMREIWPKSPNDCPEMMAGKEAAISVKDNPSCPQSLLESRYLYPPDADNRSWQLDMFDATKNVFS